MSRAEKTIRLEALCTLMAEWKQIFITQCDSADIRKAAQGHIVTKTIERWLRGETLPSPENFSIFASCVWADTNAADRQEAREAILVAAAKFYPGHSPSEIQTEAAFKKWAYAFVNGDFDELLSVKAKGANSTESEGRTQGNEDGVDSEVAEWIVSQKSAQDHFTNCLGLNFSKDYIVDLIGNKETKPSGDQYHIAPFLGWVKSATRWQKGHVKLAMIRGPIGIGKTTLLLRFLASGQWNIYRRAMFFNAQDYLIAAQHPKRGLIRLLNHASAQESPCLLMIDGLDTGVRYNKEYSELKFDNLLRVLSESFGTLSSQRELTILFTADDRITTQAHEIAERFEQWLLSKVGNLKGGSNPVFKYITPNKADWLKGWRTDYELPEERLTRISKNHPLIPTIFLDSLRRCKPDETRGVSELLKSAHEERQQRNRVSNVLYSVASEITQFREDLLALVERQSASNQEVVSSTKPTKPRSWTDPKDLAFISEQLESEKTWEWMDLLPFERLSTEFVGALWKMHEWCVQDPWRFSNSHALSNLVSTLVQLNEYGKRSSNLHYGNLSRVLLQGANIQNCEFFGVDFRDAEINEANLVIKNSIFIGCTFSPNILPQLSKFGNKLDNCRPVLDEKNGKKGR